MKKKLAVLAVILICLSSVSVGTLAYFTADTTAHNVITTGEVAVELEELARKNGQLVPFTNVDGVMPGTEVSKIVRVKNTGSLSAYVRIAVSETFSFAVNSGNTVDWSLIEVNYDTTNWTANGGYYYYNKPLKPGETTAPLFESVSFSKNMGNEYQNGRLELDVTVYATQSANNGANALNASW